MAVANLISIVGDEQSAQLFARFDTAFSNRPVPTLPLVMPEMRLSDHLCYWDEGYPALMLTDTALFRNPNYTSTPTPWRRWISKPWHRSRKTSSQPCKRSRCRATNGHCTTGGKLTSDFGRG
jgi:hypothetical protein